MAYITERFPSIEALMRTLEERKENNPAMKSADSSNTVSKEFCGTKNYKEAVELITHGWTEKLREIKEGFDKAVKVNSNTTASRPRPTTGIVGYAPCVPNAILGLPNSMIATEKVPQKIKAVTIVYNNSVSAGWSTGEIIECGIAVMKLVNKLELDGYRVKLTIEALATENGGDLAQCLVDVKDWRQPLDLTKLAFPMVHPSMLRRIMFRWLETVPNLTNTGYSCGYGQPKSSNDYDKVVKEYREKRKCLGETDYYLTSYMVKEEKHDIERIMKRAGMSALAKGV